MQNMNPTATNMNNFMSNQILAMLQNNQLKSLYNPLSNNTSQSPPIYNLT